MQASDPAMQPPPPRTAATSFVVFKWAVYGLLALNIALFALHGTPAETVDTAAWVVLLLLFEWETGGWRIRPRWLRLLHALRIIAAMAIVWACISYGLQREWLDFANAATWLAVVVALEAELRVGARRRRFHRIRRGLTLALYIALVGFALAWGLGGAWLDFWDALLWLVAFAVIELNLFGWDHRPAAAPAR